MSVRTIIEMVITLMCGVPGLFMVCNEDADIFFWGVCLLSVSSCAAMSWINRHRDQVVNEDDNTSNDAAV